LRQKEKIINLKEPLDPLADWRGQAARAMNNMGKTELTEASLTKLGYIYKDLEKNGKNYQAFELLKNDVPLKLRLKLRKAR
jgi:hypothetical protein